VIYRKAI